jgi:hypothetical protein
MKTRFENAIELREPGKFVFDINPAPGEGEIVRVDGRIVERRIDGRYELDHRPSRLDAIVVERCAGPHYTPPVRWVLARAAYRNERRALLAAFVSGEESELIGLGATDVFAEFERVATPELEAFLIAATGDAVPGTCTVTAIRKE